MIIEVNYQRIKCKNINVYKRNIKKLFNQPQAIFRIYESANGECLPFIGVIANKQNVVLYYYDLENDNYISINPDSQSHCLIQFQNGLALEEKHILTVKNALEGLTAFFHQQVLPEQLHWTEI